MQMLSVHDGSASAAFEMDTALKVFTKKTLLIEQMAHCT